MLARMRWWCRTISKKYAGHETKNCNKARTDQDRSNLAGQKLSERGLGRMYRVSEFILKVKADLLKFNERKIFFINWTNNIFHGGTSANYEAISKVRHFYRPELAYNVIYRYLCRILDQIGLFQCKLGLSIHATSKWKKGLARNVSFT